MNIALILSGGTGLRLGADTPKQYIEVNNKPVIAYAVEAFLNCERIDRIHIVAADEWVEYIKKAVGVGNIRTLGNDNIKGAELCKLCDFSRSGENRQLSILNGLRDIKKYANDDDNIIIHDAARPFVTVDTIEAIIEKLETGGAEAVTPVLPIKDTVYYYDFISGDEAAGKCDTKDIYAGGKFISTADRSRLVAGQTPEGFKLGKYLAATEALLPERIFDVTGSLQVAIDAGLKAAAVKGDEDNFKITTQKDLDRFIYIVTKS